MLLRCHDFINGEYYEDSFTGETISVSEYYRRQEEEELHRECQHYILIDKCESIVNKEKFYCDIYRWHYDLRDKKPKDVVILSRNEYIKNEKRACYYRAYKGEDYIFFEVTANRKLNADRIEEIHGFFIVYKKGRGVLYTKEQFEKEFRIR